MPIYSEKLTIPANTSEASPASLDITLNQKYIDKMEVNFPDGCNFLAKVRINYGIKQFWPEKPGTWLIGNNQVITWEERYEIPSLYEKLTISGCSPGASFDHDIVINIMTLPAGFYFLESLLDKLYNLFKRIF